jgi:hypothetical protein
MSCAVERRVAFGTVILTSGGHNIVRIPTEMTLLYVLMETLCGPVSAGFGCDILKKHSEWAVRRTVRL